MICLDSDLIVDFLRNEEEVMRKIGVYRSQLVATTIINVYELMSGIWSMRGANYQKQLNELNIFLENAQVLQLDKLSAERAAKIYGELSQNGKIIDDLDILIAAICISNNCKSLITRNVKHFSRIKGLKVESY
jgi:tRNA(fMet)-specific endonuclease VapC